MDINNMAEKKAFALLRECVAFASATSPYVITDEQEFDLYDFINMLQDEREPR